MLTAWGERGVFGESLKSLGDSSFDPSRGTWFLSQEGFPTPTGSSNIYRNNSI